MAEMISKTQIVATFPGLLPNFSDSSSAANPNILSVSFHLSYVQDHHEPIPP